MEGQKGKSRSGVVLENFRKARSKRQLKDSGWHELDAFDRNEQWEIDGRIPNWVPKPVTNFIHLVKYTKRAAFAMENPTGKLRPVREEDREAIDMLQKAYEFVWERIRARKVVRENIETSKLLGTGIAQVYWEEQAEGRMGSTVLGAKGARYEGEIKVREVDPGTFYPDPNAFCLEECEFIAVRERKSIAWLKKHPLFKENAQNLKGFGENNSPEERGEIYHRDYTTEQSNGLVDFTSYYEKKPNEDGGFSYTVTYLAGDQVLLDSQPLEPNRYPFAVLYDFPQRQDFWGKSTCEFILDNQKIINKVESILAMIGTLMQNPQKIVNKSSGINPEHVAKYGQLPGKVWESNIDPNIAMKWENPPNIPVALLNLLDNAKNNIREITGLSEAYMGQTVGSLQTSSGVDSLIERSTMRDRDQMYEIEMYIEDLSSIIIDFMVTKYTEERMIRIMGKTPEEVEFVPFVGQHYRDIEYDFFINVSAKAPITRLRQAQEAKELLNLQGQYNFSPKVITPQEYMRISEFVDSEQLIKRMDFEEMQQVEQQAEQLSSMIIEAYSQGIDPQEIMMMASEQMKAMEGMESGGTGSTSNDLNIQQRQSGVGLG